MNYRYLLFVSLFLSTTAMTQSCFDKIANQRIRVEFSRPISIETQEPFVNDLYCFLEKGMDSIDIELFLEPDVFNYLFLKALDIKDSGITYGNFYEACSTYKQHYDYPENLQTLRIKKELLTIPATIENWDLFYTLINKLFIFGLDNEEIEPLKTYLESHSDSTINMVEMLDRFEEYEQLHETETNEAALGSEELFNTLFAPTKIEFESLLQESIDTNKPVLLYFTGFGVVNARKMEANILTDPRVLEKLDSKFVFRALYIDDRTLIPESEWVCSKEHSTMVKTVGDINQNFQIETFNMDSVPYFAGFNKESKVVNTGEYGDFQTIEDFLEFMDDIILSFED